MRQTWDEFYLNIAQQTSQRSTCDRLNVGCVLVRENRIIATGYNGSIPGAPHCDDIGHDLVNNHCQRTIHSEINAIASAAKMGVSTNESVAYITHSPCLSCYKALISAGIRRIVFRTPYKHDEQRMGVALPLTNAWELPMGAIHDPAIPRHEYF